MKATGDIESVNLRTGEQHRRVVGGGESILESIGARPLTDEEKKLVEKAFDDSFEPCVRSASMSVRAKVRCTSNVNGIVCFSTVYEPDAAKDTENARFTKATPWGDIRMYIDNPVALEQFKPNQEYYVDFNLA